LVRSEGITRVSVTILLHDENYKVVAPAEIVQELKDHVQDICSKAGIMKQHLEGVLDQLLENIELVPFSVYGSKLREALQCVRDESDVPFAGVALARSPSTIVTYNKRHFNSRRLSRHEVRVLTPVETVDVL
jgi:predicted nucleic acid-binding protein